MKLIAVSLLLINLGYFLSQFLSKEGTTPNVAVQKGHELGNIQLLGESAANEKNLAMSAVVGNPVRQSSGTAVGLGCIYVGPFVDVFSGQDVLEQLQALDIVGDLKAIDVATGESDYRVLIPPASSPEEAFRKLRELQASNVDSYVITQGSQAMGISLGVFSTSAGADAMQTQLASIGYETSVIKIERQSRSYWIEMNPPQFDLLVTANWLKSNPGLTNRHRKCTEG